MKTDLFQSCGHCWVFQICCHIKCSKWTASSFRIWNSSAAISSPPPALFIEMLPKVHLTSHSSMSGSRWVTTPSHYLGSLRAFFVQIFHVFLPPLLNLFCFCYFLAIFLLYCAYPCMKCSLGISNFLKDISSLSHSIVFSIPLQCLLKKTFLSSLLFSVILHSLSYIFPFLLFLSLLFFSQLFVRPLQTTILPSCISFSWEWFKNLCPQFFMHSIYQI